MTPTTITVSVGPKDGRFLAVVASSDDIIGAYAGTEEAAALRAISLYYASGLVHKADDLENEIEALSDDAPGSPRPRAAVGQPMIRQLIEDAIRSSQRVKINYTDAAGHTTERTIDPHRFEQGREGELVEAWDELRDDVRNFRLARISRAEVA